MNSVNKGNQYQDILESIAGLKQIQMNSFYNSKSAIKRKSDRKWFEICILGATQKGQVRSSGACLFFAPDPWCFTESKSLNESQSRPKDKT